jgi:hypothetical protein
MAEVLNYLPQNPSKVNGFSGEKVIRPKAASPLHRRLSSITFLRQGLVSRLHSSRDSYGMMILPS